MTDKQRQEFVKQIKGRKIRGNNWHKNLYFIPNGKYSGTIFYGTNEKGNEDYCWINEGFNKNSYGNYWEFCNPFEQYLEEVLND